MDWRSLEPNPIAAIAAIASAASAFAAFIVVVISAWSLRRQRLHNEASLRPYLRVAAVYPGGEVDQAIDITNSTGRGNSNAEA